METLSKPVLFGQFDSLRQHALALPAQPVPTSLDFCGPSLKFSQIDQSGLVDIEQSPALLLSLLQFALQALQLASQQVVIGDRCPAGQSGLTSQQDIWAQEGRANLLEDDLIELVGPGLAFLADAVSPTGGNGVVLVAAVVANGLLTAPGLQATHTAAAAATPD